MKTSGKKFHDFHLSSNESLELWNKIKHIIKEFNGDAEKFYASFYGILVDNMLPVKFEDSTSTNILMAEVGNHILLHLSGSKITDLSSPVSTLSENEIKSLQYLSGYIIHKFYTKFQFSKNRESEFNRQCVAILQACKIDSDETQTLVNVRDRGGLWRTNGKIQDVFYQCEMIFRNKTASFITKLNCGDLVDNMFQNSTILSNFKSICHDIDPKVDKEISLDLLERILILYVRVRAFSYAKDIREKHKVAKKITKKRPLRTEIKQGSCSLETGHDIKEVCGRDFKPAKTVIFIATNFVKNIIWHVMSALFSTEIKKILDLFREKSKNDSSEKIESRKCMDFPDTRK